MAFEYKPISPDGRAFRLLRLLKGSSGPIQCQLFESKLDLPEQTAGLPEDIVDYAALSYTWGQSSRPCNIIVDGSNIAVTKNVYLALRDIRQQDQEHDQVLWVDALCINQSDDHERGQQVQQMGSIYSGAKRVIIWLGESSYDTDYVMYYMQQLEKEGFYHASNGKEISDKLWVNIWSVVVRDLTLDQKGLLVEGLQSLLKRSWFKRVWIIQETGNAGAADVVCGSSSVSSKIFALMPHLLEITPDPHCQPILDIMPGPLRDSSWWVGKRDLHTMLDKFRHSEATDSRDKIYALLSISSDVHSISTLKADYGKDIQDVVFDTTSFLLKFNVLNTRRFFEFTLLEFLRKLDTLATEVLKCAMGTGQEAVVKLLLERGAEIETRGSNSQTPLSWAAGNGHEAVVKLLLGKGAKLEAIDIHYRQTPLSWAARNGHETVVKLLLERGAKIYTKDIYSKTPLCWAIRNGHEALAKLLLEKGAEFETKGSNSQTPLSWAAGEGHKEVVKLLLEKGAKIETNIRNDQTPLSLAAENGHEAVVKLLLQKSADIKTKDRNGQTPLSLAAGNGHESVVKLLLERGARIETKSSDSQTPLSWAAGRGHKAVVRLLLEKGAEIKTKDRNSRTPLWWAAENRHQAVVGLLKKSAEIKMKSNSNLTPLSWAAKNGHEAAVKLLLEKSAKLEVKDSDFQTPLLWAAMHGHEAVVKLLLENGAKLETKDNYDSQTPLSWAIRNRHEAVVKLLLEKGAK